MKGIILGSIALIAIGVNIPARAADMPVKAPPLPATEARGTFAKSNDWEFFSLDLSAAGKAALGARALPSA